jgi:hypothetical protein
LIQGVAEFVPVSAQGKDLEKQGVDISLVFLDCAKIENNIEKQTGVHKRTLSRLL